MTVRGPRAPDGRGGAGTAAPWKVVFLVSAAAFLALAAAASVGGVLPDERRFYAWMIGGISPEAVAVFSWLNYLGDKRVLLPATLLLLLSLPPLLRRRWWLWAAVMVVAPVLEYLAKVGVGRPRPEGHSLGFPSGHVTAATAFFVMAAYLAGKSRKPHWAAGVPWTCAALVVPLVAIARIVLHAHWPLDTVGGAALGLACAAAAIWWNEQHQDSPS